MIRPTTVIAFVLAVGLGMVLFAVKYQVRDLEDELTRINRAIVAEETAIHVLKAEWSHLNDPKRLRGLARRHLGLVPVAGAQLATLRALPERSVMPEGEAE